jgi:hypothetical protein
VPDFGDTLKSVLTVPTAKMLRKQSANVPSVAVKTWAGDVKTPNVAQVSNLSFAEKRAPLMTL